MTHDTMLKDIGISATDNNPWPERGHVERFLCAYLGRGDLDHGIDAAQIQHALAYLHDLVRENRDR